MKTIDLQLQAEELQKKIDEFKFSEQKPPEHWQNVWDFITINFKLIRLRYQNSK